VRPTDIRSDLHRIADSIASSVAEQGDELSRREDTHAAGPVGALRDALLARHQEGYIEGLHDMAEAVVGYLNADAAQRRRTPVDRSVRRADRDRRSERERPWK
jgi:hypothetical protein